MKLGVIGNPLEHSWSPEIHRFLINADFKKWELQPDDLDDFFEKKDFDGINITIPYKQDVIKYLDEIDEMAEKIGAVNTIINRDGKLKGYNTDYLGLMRMMRSHNFDPKGKEVAILGTGGASKAAVEAVKLLDGTPIQVSRHPHDEVISYEEFYGRDFEYIINATPIGLYPNEGALPVELDKLPKLKGVIDIIANPVISSLVFESKLRGIPAFGGLEMLVTQGLEADKLFTGHDMADELVEKCISAVLEEKRNIVLIGMPSAGKTTYGTLLAEKLGREVIEMDQNIVDRIGMPIAQYFKEYGEDSFREIEADEAYRIGKMSGKIISTGGGVIKRVDNMRNLAHNGMIVWIDRDVELLVPTDSRPLASKVADIYKLYNERKDLYAKYCDVRVKNNGTKEAAVDELLKDIREQKL